MTQSKWAAYVKLVKDHATQTELAELTGVDQATISRWLKGARPGIPKSVADFARAFPEITTVAEAFVAAGYLTEDEVRQGLPSEEMVARRELRLHAPSRRRPRG